MSQVHTMNERNGGSVGSSTDGRPPDAGNEWGAWESRARVVLTPVSAPSVLGLFGFAAATLIVGAHLAGWYGNGYTVYYLAPFAIVFGGMAQFLAGMWSYRARDTLGTAMHGMWGSFWMAWGLLYLLVGTGAITLPPGSATYFPALGFWFIMLGLITAIGMLAAIPKGLGMFGTLGSLAAGSCLYAAALLSGNSGLQNAAGWLFVISVGFAVYTAAAMLLSETWGRTILPTFEFRKDANIPGRRAHHPIGFPEGMPGTRVGQ